MLAELYAFAHEPLALVAAALTVLLVYLIEKFAER